MIYVISGPPGSGKTTWIAERKQPGSAVVDFDDIADALGADGSRVYPKGFSLMVQAARQAVLDFILHDRHGDYRSAAGPHAYIVHTNPNAAQRDRYIEQGCELVTIDPGEDVVMARVCDERPAHLQQVAYEWYHPQARKPPRYHYTPKGKQIPVRHSRTY